MTAIATRKSVSEFCINLQKDNFCIIPAEQFKQILEENSKQSDLLLETTRELAKSQSATSEALLRIADTLDKINVSKETKSDSLLQKLTL